MKIISNFKTKQLLVKDAKKEEELITGNSDSSIEYFLKAIEEGHLPPNGCKENYKILSIYEKERQKIIGILELYHGYPDDKVLWIGQLLIEESRRKMGYGKEIIEILELEAKKCGFLKISIGVHLKNWSGIRFWKSVRFDKIIKVSGDFEYSKNTFAIMSLEKEL